jgi:hypothetical protein
MFVVVENDRACAAFSGSVIRECCRGGGAPMVSGRARNACDHDGKQLLRKPVLGPALFNLRARLHCALPSKEGDRPPPLYEGLYAPIIAGLLG